jgi:hypothetical protein
VPRRDRVGKLRLVKRWLSAAAIGAVALVSATTIGAQNDEVTLKVQRLLDGRARFLGTISSGTANEYVAVLLERCGANTSSAIDGATTEPGGSWEKESIDVLHSGTYRAKWGTHVSAPVTFRVPVRMTLTHFHRGRHLVRVWADANLNGRTVELQRLASGRWVRLRGARLEAAGALYFSQVWFTVRKKGFRLRVVVPAASAAPCHDPAASAAFKS